MIRRSLIFSSLLLSFGCGGKSKPPAAPPSTPAPAAAAPASSVKPDVLSPPIPIDHLAPRPRIRVGLTTRAEVVRLTAPQPFFLFAGDQKLRTHDLLVEREVLVGAEGVVFRVQIASSPDRERARNLLRTLENETGTSGDIAREAGSGRYAVRVGSWSTEQGAVAEKEELARRGYEGLRIVPSPTPRAAVRGVSSHLHERDVLDGLARLVQRVARSGRGAVPRSDRDPCECLESFHGDQRVEPRGLLVGCRSRRAIAGGLSPARSHQGAGCRCSHVCGEAPWAVYGRGVRHLCYAGLPGLRGCGSRAAHEQRGRRRHARGVADL